MDLYCKKKDWSRVKMSLFLVLCAGERIKKSWYFLYKVLEGCWNYESKRFRSVWPSSSYRRNVYMHIHVGENMKILHFSPEKKCLKSIFPLAGQKNMKNLSSFKIIHSPQSFDHLTSQNCCKERPYYSEGEYAASQIRGRHLQIFMETYLFEIIIFVCRELSPHLNSDNRSAIGIY